VWQIDDQRALVVTTDFFTPVVDDPYDYGAIAAANSLSDVYAMGGKPFLALNVAALPPHLPTEIGSEILRGGAEKALEAGVVIAGGHTVQDKEPKYGLMVIGMVEPERMLTKGGAQPGDVLFISKPLGFGIITTALKADKAQPEWVAEAIDWMKQLNRQAAELAQEFGAHACTDITGFSLLGHGWEMAKASGVGMRFWLDSIPFVHGAKQMAGDWAFPGGAFDNMEFYKQHVVFSNDIKEEEKMLLFDPQTSGGLLMAIPAERVEDLISRVNRDKIPLWKVGDVVESTSMLTITR
jgi:selenide,water dikinase